MTISFVENLAIAGDQRLRGLRPPLSLEIGGAMRETRDAGAQPIEPPPAISDNLRAAVNAGSLVSFVAGLSAQEISDVLYSTQLAQRAASAKFDRFAATEDWYSFYSDVMNRLGWVGETFAFTDRGSNAGDFHMDKTALDIITEIATGNQLAILVKTLDTLKNLGKNDAPLRIFELQSLAEMSGNFQIGAVQKADNGALSLALGAFRFQSSDNRTGFLFWTWGAQTIHFWTSAGKMTLNSDQYAAHRDAVEDKLRKDAGDFIAELAVA